MTHETLKAQQIKIEESSRFDIQAKTKEQLDGYVKSESEYNTNYGKKAIRKIVPVLEKYLKELIDNKPLKWGFLNKFLRPQHRFETNSKFQGTGVIQTISEMVAVNVVASMSKEPTFMNLIRSLTDTFYRIYDINLAEQEEETAIKFDNNTMSFFKALIHHIEAADELEIIIIEQDEDTSAYHVMLRPEWQQIIDESTREAVLSVASYSPMVCEPIPHTSLMDKKGGYLTENSPLLRRPIRINGQYDSDIVAFTSENNPAWFEEINRVQSTPFCINTNLLEVLLDFKSREMFFTKFPFQVKDTEEKHLDVAAKELKEWDDARKAKAERDEEYAYKPIGIRQANKVRARHKMECEESVRKTTDIMKKAEEFKDMEKIYFPVYVDERNRRYTYVHTGSLTYMGGALAKSLLHLADKEAFTDEGIRHMFITLANCLNYDKESIEMKLPKAFDFWTEHRSEFFNGNYDVFIEKQDDMDDAIGALSICLELVKHTEAEQRGEEYLSGILCHRDGRCSGASIISVLLQDEKGTKLTSVVDTVMDKEERLPDAYMHAANTGRELNKNKYLENHADVLFCRSTWKNPTMTRASYGCSETTIHKGPDSDKIGGNMKLFKDNNLDFTKCAEFTKLMMKALDASLPGCSLYLDTIKAASKEVLLMNSVWKFKIPMSGFPVVRRKMCVKKHQMSTPKGFQRVQLTFYTPTQDLDLKESLQAVAPDTIHACDAAILMMVGQDLKLPMATVHDSLAVHPNHTDKLVKSYAKAMHHLATENVLEQIFESMGTSIKAPFVGTLSEEEIESIKHSKHCIA